MRTTKPLPAIHPGAPRSCRVSVDLMIVKEVRDGFVVGFPEFCRPCDAIGRATLTLDEGSIRGLSRRYGYGCVCFSLLVPVYNRIRQELNAQLAQQQSELAVTAERGI